MKKLEQFVKQSWEIEGEYPDTEEVIELAKLHDDFLELDKPKVKDVEEYALMFSKGVGKLRDKAGMNVYVGNHIPLMGGMHIKTMLEELLEDLHEMHPYFFHQKFEALHPFMDGNGRVGRLLWLYGMNYQGKVNSLSFLHHWYYQSLEFGRG